jgi:sorting nexin-4
MERDDFANISWQNNPAGQGAAPFSTSLRDEGDGIGPGNPNGKRRESGGQLGRNADPLDLAGVEGGVLECTVSNPNKENDGSKDAYVSYLVTTNVCITVEILNR